MRFVIACLSIASVSAGAFACRPHRPRLTCRPRRRPIQRSAPAQPGPRRIIGQAFRSSAGVSVWGGKGVKGGVGGETDLTYEHVFDNGIMLGVQASTGYMPYLQTGPGYSQFTGGAFAGGSAIVGYNFGQVTPYVITGVDFVRSTRLQQRRFQRERLHQHGLLGPRRRTGGRHGRRRRQLPLQLEFQHGARSDRAHESPGSTGAFGPWP